MHEAKNIKFCCASKLGGVKMTLGPVASIKSRNQNSEYVSKGW